MRVTDIRRCEVRPGRLVEWTLSASTVEKASGLPEDSRPPAYLQEAHLRTSRKVRSGGLFVPTWIGVAFDIPGRVDLDVLEDALRRWTLRHETMRSGFRWTADDEMRRFTLAPRDVTLRREPIGDFPDGAVLARHLQDRFDVAADSLGWPNFLYAAVVRDDGTSVYMAFDHSNVDSYSLQRVSAEVHELYAAGVERRTLEEPSYGSYVDFCEVERGNADQVDEEHDIVARWREFIRRCGGRLPSFPVELGQDPHALTPQVMMSEMLVDAGPAAAFEAYCRPYGGSLVGLLAATGLVVHELGGAPVYRTVVPFHTRATSKWSQSVGWYVGGAPVELPVTSASDFPGALRIVRDQLRANRRLARVPLPRVLDLLGDDFRATSPDLYSILSFVDARGITGSEHWAEWKTYGLVRVSYGTEVCVWVNRLHEGLHLATRHPDTDIAHKNMRLYVERLRDFVHAVAAAGR
ncbi:condensation domain-containing protein [Streptomyces sp. NPDC057411]|uniref:condensation domain-containing protein n=1 Tax=unclassified Streptomyces TaxID=2593676 RepID=UPI00362DE725